MANETHPTQRLKKMRQRKAKPFATVITTGLSVSSGLMLGFAVPNLIGADSGLDFAKAISALRGITCPFAIRLIVAAVVPTRSAKSLAGMLWAVR